MKNDKNVAQLNEKQEDKRNAQGKGTLKNEKSSQDEEKNRKTFDLSMKEKREVIVDH